MDQRRKVINDAFLVTLFQILVEGPAMTATEVLERAKEKGALLAPTMGRQQSEALGPMIERELDILARVPGALPPLPDALKRAGGAYEIEYDSPLNRAQRAEDGAAINRVLQNVAPLMNVDPSIMDAFDSDAIVRILAEVNGMPEKAMRDPDAIAALRQRRQQAQALQQMATLGPPAAQAIKDVSEAQATAKQSGGAASHRYLMGEDYTLISQALQEQLLAEEEVLHDVKQSLHQMEEELFKRLWETGRMAAR